MTTNVVRTTRARGGSPAPERRRYGVDLAAHMAECDANYARLVKLMPDMVDCDTRRFRLSHNGRPRAEVCLEVLERCPYTTFLRLTQHDLEPAALPFSVDAPEITVRLYHDAQSAEVVTFQHTSRFAPVNDYPNRDMHYPDEKAAVNRFLGEYLGLCLRHGERGETDETGATAGPR